MRKHPKRLEDNRTRCGCGRVNEERMPTRQSTHADRGLLPWFDSPAHPQQHLKDRSSGSHGRGIGSAWITAYSPATLFPLLDRLEKKAIWDHRSKGMAVKATRASQKPQGPARYGGSEGQRVASDSASLSLRTDSQTLWMARIETNLPSQHYYGSASKASSDGVDPPILAAALTGIAILPKGGINVFQ